ncbi:MAG TPA: serine hydrolase [Ktedonobacterales bacterium]|nr:serine hydrolase [Ktedonobacterales bacterium]
MPLTKTPPDTDTAHRAGAAHLTLRRALTVSLITALWLMPIIGAVGWLTSHNGPPARQPSAASSPSAAQLLARQTRTTTPHFSYSAAGSHPYAIDARFTAYYAAHGGAALLGQPTTLAYSTTNGWVQFFTSGALLLPSPDQAAGRGPSASDFGDLAQPAFAGGTRDAATGIIRLPLLVPLLSAGSLAPLHDAASATYADLRRAIVPVELVGAVTGNSVDDGVRFSGQDQPTFTYSDAHGNQQSGRLIPAAMWQYIQRPEVAPNGWQQDVGLPLTPPVQIVMQTGAAAHHVQVMAFWHSALLEDDDDLDDDGAPHITPLATGVAYLRTLGAPPVTITASQRAWSTGNTTLQTSPGTGSAAAHIGQNFPLTLSGASQWVGNDLWLGAHWQGPHAAGDGWADASMLTFSAPAAGTPAWASFDVLSPALAGYLSGLGRDSGAAVYDLTRHQYYTYNADNQYIMASSAKVPIMTTFLSMTERQGREPNANEMYLLTTMIENSNNDSAESLWLEVGGAPAVDRLMRSLKIPGLSPDYAGEWGYSTVSPLAMVRLLTALHEGTVLTAHDRALAFNLMSHIESDQQTGVGTTAPNGAHYWMKDGWVPGPDGRWAMNSSGIVTIGNETYIIAVYSHHKATLTEGWAIAEHVCGEVGKLLTA